MADPPAAHSDANKQAPDQTVDPKKIGEWEKTRDSWKCPGLPLLRRLEVELCRTEHRPDKLRGRKLAAIENAVRAAATMAFQVLNEVFNFLRKHGSGEARPKLNQIEAHLACANQKLNRRLSACLKGTTDGSEFGQARDALKFLLLGPSANAASEEAKVSWTNIDTYFFRIDDDDDSPRYMLPNRRPHGTPCSATELSGELQRATRKLKYGLARSAEIVWVLGPSPFPRHDLMEQLPDVIKEAITAQVKVEFVFTNDKVEAWKRHPGFALPSVSLDAFETNHLAGSKGLFLRRPITADTPGGSGAWTFLSPCNEWVYVRVEPDPHHPWSKEEFLYQLRGRAGKDTAPRPLVYRANSVEQEAFEYWLERIRSRTAN